MLNVSTEAEQSVVTGADGRYHFFALQPGTYTITVTKTGFSALRREGVVLRVGDQVVLDLALQIGNVTESVNVTADAPLLQSSRGTVSFVVEQQKVVTLPLDGRNFIPLIALAPGVMLPPASTLPRINGSRPRVSEYIYDGISVLQPEPGQVAYFPVVDAIEEFRVETNSYSAEYGRSNGGVIMVNHKSGSNDFHGSLFEFFRNEALNARNLFATTGPKPRFRRNQYGFVFGGPIQRNKTFFFVDYQGTRLQTGTVRTSTVPTTAAAAGNLQHADLRSDDDTPDRFRIRARPVSQRHDSRGPRSIRPSAAVLDRYPAPNVFVNGQEATANNYVRVGNETTDQEQFGVRLDHNLNSTQRIFGRYAYLRDDSRPVTPFPDGSGIITTGVIGDTLTRADSVALEHSWTLSANTGESAPVRIYAARLRSRIVANRPAGIGGIGHSEHSGIRVFGRAADLRCRGLPAAGTAGERQCRIHDFGDSVRRQLFMAARPPQHETGRRLAHRAPRCPAAAQSDRIFPVHQHSDQRTCRPPERR